MMHWYNEGDDLHNGINVYHPDSKSSVGFIIRIKNRVWRARYSKLAKKWFFSYYKALPNTLQDWEEWADKV